ncbi:MAG: threonine/serine dehydratase [Thermoplasmatales archaeon]
MNNADSRGNFVTVEDIEEAAENIKGYVTRSPLIFSPYFSDKTGREVYLKAEIFQPTRVFKLRGVVNKLQSLRSAERVVTASSGNHGLSLAYASKIFRKKARIFVPEWANPDKVNAITSFGAEVAVGGDSYEAAHAKAVKYSNEVGAEFIHPFEDPYVIAGQGTIGLEIFQDKQEIDTVVVPVGGGGLISGISTALKSLNPGVRVIGVQSENNPTSVNAYYGKEISAEIRKSIADGLITKMASKITMEIIKRNVDRMVAVKEEEIENSLISLLINDHFLVEPSGAAPLASLLNGSSIDSKTKRVAVILSGGNINIGYLKKLLQKELT